MLLVPAAPCEKQRATAWVIRANSYTCIPSKAHELSKTCAYPELTAFSPSPPAGRNRAVKGTKRCKLPISRLVDYPVNGFVIEAGDAGADEVAAVVGAACARMQAANVPHNLLIADCGARVFLWPQAFAEKQVRGGVHNVVERARCMCSHGVVRP